MPLTSTAALVAQIVALASLLQDCSSSFSSADLVLRLRGHAPASAACCAALPAIWVNKAFWLCTQGPARATIWPPVPAVDVKGIKVLAASIGDVDLRRCAVGRQPERPFEAGRRAACHRLGRWQDQRY